VEAEVAAAHSQALQARAQPPTGATDAAAVATDSTQAEVRLTL